MTADAAIVRTTEITEAEPDPEETSEAGTAVHRPEIPRPPEKEETDQCFCLKE